MARRTTCSFVYVFSLEKCPNGDSTRKHQHWTTATVNSDRKRPATTQVHRRSTETATVQVWFELRVGDLVRVDAVDVSQDAQITHLRDAVKVTFANDLRDVDPGDLTVYPAGTSMPVGDGMRLGAVVPPTTGPHPLIVVARLPVVAVPPLPLNHAKIVPPEAPGGKEKTGRRS
jgi:hypothetical protein